MTQAPDHRRSPNPDVVPGSSSAATSATALGALIVCAALAACSSSNGDGVMGGSGGASGGSGGAAAGSGDAGAGSGGQSGGSGGASGPDIGSLAEYKSCGRDKLAGEVALVMDVEAGFTGVLTGFVLDGVEPFRGSTVVSTSGMCQLKQPPKAPAPCQPACAAEQNCTESGCVAKPKALDVGKMIIDGLKVPSLELSRNGSNIYTNPPAIKIPHPGFDEGTNLRLTVEGKDNYGPLMLHGFGVGALEVPEAPITVEMGQPVTLTWGAPGKTGPTRVLINFSVNRHGAVDTWLECSVPDTGSFAIDGALVTELFQYGTSGFPSVSIQRQSADSTTVPSGCMEFSVSTSANRELMVPGVVSCQDDMDCPQGQTCQIDLKCG